MSPRTLRRTGKSLSSRVQRWVTCFTPLCHLTPFNCTSSICPSLPRHGNRIAAGVAKLSGGLSSVGRASSPSVPSGQVSCAPIACANRAVLGAPRCRGRSVPCVLKDRAAADADPPLPKRTFLARVRFWHAATVSSRQRQYTLAKGVANTGEGGWLGSTWRGSIRLALGSLRADVTFVPR